MGVGELERGRALQAGVAQEMTWGKSCGRLLPFPRSAFCVIFPLFFWTLACGIRGGQLALGWSLGLCVYYNR